MENVSEELRNYFKIFNQSYVTILKAHHPYIKKLVVDEESFYEAVLNNVPWAEFNIIACIEYSGKEYFDFREKQKNEGKERGIGADSVEVALMLSKMLPNSEVLNGKVLLTRLLLNTKKYCEGVVPWVRD